MSTDTELRDPATRQRPDASGDREVAGRRSSRRRDVVVVVVALLTGMGLVAGFGAVTGSGDDSPSIPAIDADFTDTAEPSLDPDASVVDGTPAGSPADAVEQFLTAEAAGDLEASYSMLSDQQRAEYGSAAMWVNAHADFFPVADFEILETTDGTVVTEMQYRSSLDEIIGLVPARARVEWPTVEQNGGWLVDFDAASVAPRYPDDADAVDSVTEWAAAKQRCDEPEQYSGALVATADLRRTANGLCDRTGPVSVPGPARTLDEFDASGFVSAFGSHALSWARAVDLEGPVAVTVVVAPIDDRWVVIGLLPPS